MNALSISLLAALSLTLAGCGEKAAGSKAAAISSPVSTTVLAGPDQLDILGLVPGVSELTQVKQAAVNPKQAFSNEMVNLEIGGYKIPCRPTFLNGKLAHLLCFTGDQFTEASNTEVHSTLTEGFTKKLGKPETVHIEPVRTKMGVEYEQQNVVWTDKRGNVLQLTSILGNVERGSFSLTSFEQLKQWAKEDAEKAVGKKF